MWLIDLENAPERLRGTLARWGVEVRAGLYVGSASLRMRDALWATVQRLAWDETSAVMVWDTTGPQGFEVRTLGPNRREIVDVDGMWLARFQPPPPSSETHPDTEGDGECREEPYDDDLEA